MVQARVWSLNGARFTGASPEEEARPLAWLRSLLGAGADAPDVLCLQDVRASVLGELRALPYVVFVPMTIGRFFGRPEALGICIASRWQIRLSETAISWGDGIVRGLEGVDERNERCGDPRDSDRLVRATQNRVVVAGTIMVPGWQRGLRVATHHGFWTRDGEVEPEQLESARRVADFLARQGRTHGGVLYLADFNPDKHGRVYDIYRNSGAHDLLPSSIATTLAPEHPAAALGIRSDCVMAWPDRIGAMPFSSAQVEVSDAPGSDHLLLRASVEPR